MSAPNFAKSCGPCHVGGGSMEYDKDMNEYSNVAGSTDSYTYRPNRIVGGSVVAGGIVTTASNAANELYAGNKAEVDCMMCHMNGLKTGAAWYLSMGCAPGNTDPAKMGPADDLFCTGSKFTGLTSGTFYDSFNRNIAVSLGFMKQAASAGVGALIDLTSGTLSNVPQTIPGASIAGVPNSANCAQCHARTTEAMGLPMMAPQYGGMTVGFGNFFRITPAGEAFDFDRIDGSGNCASAAACSNLTMWNEFGCKTGMGKRSQKSGQGDQDRFGFGVCMGCSMMSYMGGGPMMWLPAGLCNIPDVQTSCNTKAGANLQANPMAIMDSSGNGMPARIVTKMVDVDAHDAVGVKCATCHNGISGTFNRAQGSLPYTFASTSYEKMDHQVAQGWSTLEKANDVADGTVTCESCHGNGLGDDAEATHANKNSIVGKPASIPVHGGFPANHISKIDCRTCHIPIIYNAPGRLLLRDWTAGGYRQTDGSNGNANHFDFSFNFADGNASQQTPMKVWVKVAKPTGDELKITAGLPSMLPMWMNGVTGAPAFSRDVTAAAALVSAQNPGFGIRINGTNEHPPFQGFHLTDPLKIESLAKITAMRAELAGTGSGYATHNAIPDAKLNLQPFFFDASHGITSKTMALGSTQAGGCVMCHASNQKCLPGDNPLQPGCQAGDNPMYNASSVGFFDGSKELLKNPMMQMADYDCSEIGATGQGMMMCGFFDAMGSTPGTCEAAEFAACNSAIAPMLFEMFGLPASVGTAMPMDGVELSRYITIKEGATAAGCNPIYAFFGQPDGCDWDLSDGSATIWSRDEIRLHFKKNLQQVVVGGANKVYGKIKVGSVNEMTDAVSLVDYDYGTQCYNVDNGMMGMPYVPCTDGGYVATNMSEKTLLGFSETRRNHLMSLFIDANTPVTVNGGLCTDPTNAAPVASYTIAQAGNVVTLTDTSTDNVAIPAGKVTVSWGDGSTSTGNQNGVFVHTYATMTKKYTIKHAVTDAGVQGLRFDATTNTCVPLTVINTPITNPVTYSSTPVMIDVKMDSSPLQTIAVTPVLYNYAVTVVSGATGTVPVNGATIALRVNGKHTKFLRKGTNGTTTFSVPAGNYSVQAWAPGYKATRLPVLSTQLVNISSNATGTVNLMQ